jgi:uncharacterized protein (TIGR03437 family)
VTSASTGGSFSVIYPPVPFSIGAGGQQSVTVLCNPTATGSVNGSLSIASSDPAQPNIKVPLQAEAVAGPESTVSLPSNSVDFGNVVVGQSTAASFQVNSLGPGILNISKFQSGNGAYSMASPSLPFSVQPGQSQAVTVKFTPAAVGSQNTVFTLTSDDPDAPSVAINATGAGVASNSGTPSYSAISVLNAASGQGGGVSPGEMVVIYGSNLGPASLAGLQLSNGAVATSAGNTQVLFDGAPAPIIYASAGQTAVMVPYEVAVGGVTEMQVVYNGVKSNVASLQVVDVIPGLFTANASGKGPGAILNQDLSVNSAANPAAPGSVVVLYGTGEGQTNPVGLDGALTGTVWPLPIAPVSVTIGGVGATVGYAGEAPGLVAGMLQVNATIPAGLGSGAQPVVVTVGGASSQPGVTVAVKGAGGTGGDTTTGLVGWWKFDEAAGSTVTDSSGNGNAGTISGGVTRVPGMFGGALSFDGSTGFITGSSPGTDFPTGSAARTITAWINITNAQTVDNALLHYGSYGGAPPAINFHLFITGTGSDAAVGNGYGFGVVQGTASVADGQWHNVAGVYEGPGTNIARIYVDGVEQSSATLTDVPDTGVATPWRIGNFLAGGGLYRGLMDDVRIYDRALSATDLQALSAGH